MEAKRLQFAPSFCQQTTSQGTKHSQHQPGIGARQCSPDGCTACLAFHVDKCTALTNEGKASHEVAVDFINYCYSVRYEYFVCKEKMGGQNNGR